MAGEGTIAIATRITVRILRRPETVQTLLAAFATIDAGGAYLLPGFIQTHVHLCQTLFRGHADDMPLLDWLKRRVWPMEAAHTRASIRASAQVGVAEMIKGGTTCALTMPFASPRKRNWPEP